ncbi:Enhancer of mRNA-decapping protein 3 [Candida viswanathii]|uniref:Enhancer of mRNA-decapping protein 3 n=1 Tax=Candida viswanathii TaxID=5486 RepID=A0A367XPP1_9ASCO|nr:Enhancer of mRNA-decapping protein 3 [Candida viswanathii]
MMAEVCAINLSQLMMESVLGGASRLSNKKNHNLPPLVLLLIGSSRGGSRAFATGRHLTNHGVRVLAFMINTDEVDSDLQQQWKLFELSGGKVVIGNVLELLDIVNNQLDTPVEVIIDALQGYDDHLEDVFYQEEDQTTLRKLVKWCNEPQQQNKIMSLDIPSGIDGGSGTLLDDSLKLNCRCSADDEVIHYVVDIGIPNKVYSNKGNLRKFDKFWFSSEASLFGGSSQQQPSGGLFGGSSNSGGLFASAQNQAPSLQLTVNSDNPYSYSQVLSNLQASSADMPDSITTSVFRDLNGGPSDKKRRFSYLEKPETHKPKSSLLSKLGQTFRLIRNGSASASLESLKACSPATMS